MAFAPSTLSAFEEQAGGRPPRLEQRFFGLLGPNGPLPLHLTEYARDRLRHHGDRTLVRFLDLFHHRLALLFYRAWAEARPTVQHDRPDEDRFATYVGSLAGYGSPGHARSRRRGRPRQAVLRRAPRAEREERRGPRLHPGGLLRPARARRPVRAGLARAARDQRTVLGGEQRPSGHARQRHAWWAGGCATSRAGSGSCWARWISTGSATSCRAAGASTGSWTGCATTSGSSSTGRSSSCWPATRCRASAWAAKGAWAGRRGSGARRAPTDAADLILAPERMRPRDQALAAAVREEAAWRRSAARRCSASSTRSCSRRPRAPSPSASCAGTRTSSSRTGSFRSSTCRTRICTASCATSRSTAAGSCATCRPCWSGCRAGRRRSRTSPSMCPTR